MKSVKIELHLKMSTCFELGMMKSMSIAAGVSLDRSQFDCWFCRVDLI